MKNVMLATALIVSLASGSIRAADRVPVALAEGFDFATQPQVPITRGPLAFLELVNGMLGRSSLVIRQEPEAAVKAIAPLRLNLLALETGKANEITFAFSVQQRASTGQIVRATDLQLRTCELTAMDSCAAFVVRAIETAATEVAR